ncbi:MAG: GNAT family N-acetyltransferase [Planctomycetes bacterium]|nr:GNAT family N-acetyltransferase [Planctomycetota bacterium]
MNKIYYAGQHLYFRAIEPADADTIIAWRNDPEQWRTLGEISPLNRIREIEFIEKLYKPGEDIVLGIALRKDDRFVGMCGLHAIQPIAHSATFGILIGETTDQGKGYGTEATQLMVRYGFEELNLNRIELCVFAKNKMGHNVYKRAGFKDEGLMREAYYRNGKYHDVLHMAVLKREWQEQTTP